MASEVKLPPLPQSPKGYVWYLNNGDHQYTDEDYCPVHPEEWSHAAALYDAAQMEAYARAAVEANRGEAVTEAMVETACKAMARDADNCDWPDDYGPEEVKDGTRAMRAALTAALSQGGKP